MIYFYGKTMKRIGLYLSPLLRYALGVLLLGAALTLAEAAPVGVRYTLAQEVKLERLQVILTHGLPTRLTLPGKPSGRVHRYQTDALAAEAVMATYDAAEASWVIDNPAAGYGYFVEYTGELPEYTYLIDYAQHKPQWQTIAVDAVPADPCSKVRLRLEGQPAPTQMVYYTPSGVRKVLPFRAELRYQSLVWQEEQRVFVPQSLVREVEYTDTEIEYEASLADTAYSLAKDLWAEALGLTTQPLASTVIESSRIEAHAGIELEQTTGEVDRQQLSAPSTLRLWARGNEPATAKYQWRIERLTPEGSTPVLSYTGQEVEHTLTESGRYRISLECLSRDARCSDNSFEEEVRITESALELPNAFTPGSTPGINDIFRALHRSLVSFQAKVFSASGQELYRWTDPNQGWDGTYRGQLVPTGAYYYAVDAVGADGIRYEKRGVVHVLRSEFDTF